MAEQARQASSNVDPLSADRYFREIHEVFSRAGQSAGRFVDRFFSIGGHLIRLCFAGPGLVDLLTPSFAHLATDAGDPELTICIWDTATTGTPMPLPPWRAADRRPRGEIVTYTDDRIRTVFQTGDYTLSMIDLQNNLGLYWLPDAGQTPYYETAAPFRTILNWWMADHGLQVVHAAAVGTCHGGALLGGKSGSGKSTTALACLDAGFSYIGDDYVLARIDPHLHIFSLYNAAKIQRDNLCRLSFIPPAALASCGPESEKALLFLSRYYTAQIRTDLPLRLVLLPRVTGSRGSRWSRISPSAALASLAPSTIFQLPGAGAQALNTLGSLLQQVPSYQIELGSDLAEVTLLIRDLLANPPN